MPRQPRRRRPSPSSSSSSSEGSDAEINPQSNLDPLVVADPFQASPPAQSPSHLSFEVVSSGEESAGGAKDAASSKSGASGRGDYDQESLAESESDEDSSGAASLNAVAGEKGSVSDDAKHPVENNHNKNSVGDDTNHPSGSSRIKKEVPSPRLSHQDDEDDGSSDDCIVTGETCAPTPAENFPAEERAAASAGASDEEGEKFTVAAAAAAVNLSNSSAKANTRSAQSQASKHDVPKKDEPIPATAGGLKLFTSATPITTLAAHLTVKPQSSEGDAGKNPSTPSKKGEGKKKASASNQARAGNNASAINDASAGEANEALRHSPAMVGGGAAAPPAKPSNPSTPTKRSEGKQDANASRRASASESGDAPRHSPAKAGGGAAAPPNKLASPAGDGKRKEKDGWHETPPPPEKRLKPAAGEKAAEAPGSQQPAPSASLKPDELGEKRAREQEQKIAALENMLRATQERASYQSELLILHKEQIAAYREKADDLAEQQQLQENMIFSMQNAEPPKPSKFAKLDDLNYAKRLEYLVQQGHGMSEAMEALEATRQDGQCSSQRAEAHLNAQQDAARKALLQAANAAAADMPEILEKSALGVLLSKHSDAVDIVTRMRDIHAKSRIRNAHKANLALCAATQVEAAGVKNDTALMRKGHLFLCQVASAVSEDCAKCGELRNKLEQEVRWAQEKEKVAAEKAKAQEERKRQAAKEEQRLREHKPHVVNFKVQDSRHDVTLPRGFCGGCDKGSKGGRWLYHCGKCKRGYHVLCTVLSLIRSRGTEYFACSPCLDEMERKLRDGEAQEPFEFLGSDIARGKAPGHGEADPNDSLDQPEQPPLAGGGAARNNLSHLFQTPRANPNVAAFAHTEHRDAPPPSEKKDDMGVTGGNGGRAESVPESSEKNQDSRTSYQVKDYFIWEVVPKDWTPKVDPKADAERETLPEHPDKGYSKTAYQHWRRRNVTARDVVRANKGSLGPLTRALSAEMKVTLGTQFIKEPALSWLWPKPIMTGPDIAAWIKDDPAFKWVEKIPDEILLSLCDKRFGVRKNDLFLTRRFTSSLPKVNSKGEVNYHVVEFDRWLTEWQNELSELMQSGCDFQGVNLRQTLINALSTNTMLHNEASVFQCDSIYELIAHLRDWLMNEEQAEVSRRNKQKSVLDLVNAGAQPQQATVAGLTPQQVRLLNGEQPTPRNPQVQKEFRNASVLLTKLMEQNQQLLGAIAASGGPAEGDRVNQRKAPKPPQAPGDPRTYKPLPDHLKEEGEHTCKCQGCNNVWNRARVIPCYKECKYVDHPAYNKQCHTQPNPLREKLTWNGFTLKYPGLPVPQGYLDWVAYLASNDGIAAARKRERDGNKK